MRLAFTLLGVLLIAIGRAAPASAAPVELDVRVTARALQPGEVVRMSVACACTTAPRVTVFDHVVPLTRLESTNRWTGLFGIDVDVVPGAYVMRVEALDSVRNLTVRVESKAFATRTLTVAPEYVEPPADVVQRIVDEAAMLDRLYQSISPVSALGTMSLPLRTRPTLNFGQRSVFNGQARSPHAGVDFRGATGTAIAAPAPGTVVLARDLYFTGNTVILDHGGGLLSVFAHLSTTSVRVGDAIAKGTVLGRVGATGRVTGPHLHWSVRLGGARVDPLSLVDVTNARGVERSLPAAD